MAVADWLGGTAPRCGCATRSSSASSRSNGWPGSEFVAHYSEVGSGYDPDHEFFGYRQSI